MGLGLFFFFFSYSSWIFAHVQKSSKILLLDLPSSRNGLTNLQCPRSVGYGDHEHLVSSESCHRLFNGPPSLPRAVPVPTVRIPFLLHRCLRFNSTNPMKLGI